MSHPDPQHDRENEREEDSKFAPKKHRIEEKKKHIGEKMRIPAKGKHALARYVTKMEKHKHDWNPFERLQHKFKAQDVVTKAFDKTKTSLSPYKKIDRIDKKLGY